MNKLTLKSPKIPKLKPRYQAFADSILKCRTQRQAALDAGFPTKRADTQAHRMSKNEQIVSYIEYHRSLLAEKNSVTLEDVVPTLRRIRDDNRIKRPQVAVQACVELAKIGRLYTDAAGTDSRPSFVGISINMGEGTVKMVSTKDKALKDIESIDVDSSIE